MKTSRLLLAGALLAFGMGEAAAEGVELLKKEDGPWKASCYKDADVEAPYCRIMIINVFSGTKKSANFVQFGPAFDRGNIGFVFASYFGFAPESKVKVKIDKNSEHVLQTSQANHTIAPQDMSKTIFEQMNAGKSITVDFKLSSGITRALDFPLAGFKKLYPEVKAVMESKS